MNLKDIVTRSEESFANSEAMKRVRGMDVMNFAHGAEPFEGKTLQQEHRQATIALLEGVVEMVNERKKFSILYDPKSKHAIIRQKTANNARGEVINEILNPLNALINELKEHE